MTMAIEKWKYFCFAFVFTILSSTHSKSTRFGLTADSLFFPPQSDSSFSLLQVDSVEEDEIDRLLHRYARSNDAPPKSKLSEFHLNDNHTTLIVHWAGKGSDVILALSKNGLKGSDSNVFISRDYGKTFSKINDKFRLTNGANAVIDRYYNTKQYNSHYVFTDIINQCVFTTRDYAMTVMRYCNLPFRPRVVSIHEINPSIVLAMDEESPSKQLYITENFGFSWRIIHDNVKAFFWGVVPYDNNTDVYVEEIAGSHGNSVWRSTDYFHSARNKVQLISGVRDFQVMDQYLFATKHVRLLGASSPTTQLWVSYNRGGFRKAEFPSHMHQEEFYIADASESQVMACVNHNRTVTHLYVSEVQGLKFSLSLERVVYFNPKGANNDTWLRYYANVTFADIHKVDGMRGIYIASQVVNGTFDVNNQRSLITFDKGGEWRLLRAPDYDSAGRPTNCSVVANWTQEQVDRCSLHVTQMLNQFYPGSRSVPILSRKSAPGIILASGVIGKSIKTNPDVFISTNAGISWHQVLDGNYMYTFADHGGIIVAVKQFASTDSIYVSNDEGKSWKTVKFSSVKIRVYGILTEPGETTSIFSIFGSHLGRHSWIISQIDLKPAKKCVRDDYKNWTLPKTNFLHGCLLGRRMVYERKIADALCYNGRDYMRSIRKENCSCTREDFECDFGFKLDITGCVPDPMSNQSLINQVPSHCPPGTYYPFSRGYRKVVGDTCHGGVENQYMPLMYSCPVEERREFILFSTQTSIASVDLDNNRFEVLVDEGLNHVTYVDFDYVDNCVYWADSMLNVIKRQCLGADGKGQEIVLSFGLRSADGLAFEWTAGQIYWTDADRHIIEVARKDGSFRRVLYKDQRRLGHPQSLVLDPLHGYLYWIDRSLTNSRIIRAWMDGTNSSIQTIVHSSVAQLPTGLTIDLSAERLYWTDVGSHKIMSSDLDGRNQRVLVSGRFHLPEPYSIGIYKSNMYWTDWEKHAIMMAAKTSGQGVHMVLGDQTTITDLKIVSNSLQRVHSACSPGNHACSQLCLPKPHPTVHGQPNRTCKCADNVPSRILQESGDEKCQCKSAQEKMDTSGNCVLVSGSTCAPGQFHCQNHTRCIPSTWQCDHDNDCVDGSDEVDCPYSTCPPDNMACTDGRCIPLRWKCDTDSDCPDGSDERDCQYPLCKDDQFQCTNHRCISKQWLCDFENDCHDGSDEFNCNHTSCRSWEHQCASGDCIGTEQLCNGQHDCEDGSDETNCTLTTCSPWSFKCHNSSKCIHRTWVCDGDSDCDDHSDEIGCTTTSSTITTSVPGSCSTSQFTCDNGFCVWWSSRCDTYNDCGDNSDEQRCGYVTTTTVPHTTTSPPVTTPCPLNKFRCDNGQCISEYYPCNGIADCDDGSDEKRCGATCGPDRFECSEGHGAPSCIWLSYVCDGQPDCFNGEDEKYCNETVVTCSSSEFRCMYSGGCIPESRYCNGYPDCEDHSDEWGCGSNTTTVAPPASDCRTEAHSFHCPYTDQCIPWLFVCDHHPDCNDRSDERLHQCSDQVVLNVKILSVMDTTIQLQWDAYSGKNVKYMVSYLESNSHAFYSNTTVKASTSARLHSLHPLTEYVMRVYVVLGGRYLPGTALRITTLQAVPSVPRSFHAQMVNIIDPKIALQWKKPEKIYGEIIAYLIHLKSDGTSLETVIKCDQSQCFGKTVHFDLTEQYLQQGVKYEIWVSAVNDAGEGAGTAHKMVTFSKDASQEVVKAVVVTKHDMSSISLSWKPVSTATSYTVRMQYQSTKEKQFTTSTANISITNLCPGNGYAFQVVPVFKSGHGNPSSVRSVSTTGKPIGHVTGLAVKKTDNVVVMVTFNSSVGNPMEYIVYYHEHFELPEEEVMDKAQKVTTKTTYLTIHGLLACERYFFRVAAFSPYCPLSDPVTVETSEDDKAPPKHLTFQLTHSNSVLTLFWDPPCDQQVLHLDYVLRTVEVGSSKRPYVVKVRGNHDKQRQSYPLDHLLRGATYRLNIKTMIPYSRYSGNLTVSMPRYSKPLNLDVFPVSGKLLLRWEQNKMDMPPSNLFHGFLVFVSSNEKSYIRHTNVTTILLTVPTGFDYTFSVCYDAIHGYYGDNATLQLPYFSDGVPATGGGIASTNIIAIVVPICAVVLILVVILSVFVVRHRRLQRSFLAFANSHYDTRSGMTTFGSGDGLDDEDSPMIQGFSDDEPLITA